MSNTTEAKAPCPLAVMDDAIRYEMKSAAPSDVWVAELREARAKVAELVAAASHFMSATYPPAHDEPVSREEQDEFAAAWKRLRAALAAFSEVQP